MLLILGMLLGYGLSAQQLIEVGWDKTTYLMFDSEIESVDRGSRFLLSQRDEAGLNLLKLKAGSRDLGMTNLHVLTADGTLYDFTVTYADSPAVLTVDLRKPDQMNGRQVLMKSSYSKEDFEEIHAKLGSTKTIARSIAYQMDLLLNGIYFEEGLLFFEFSVANNTVIPFEQSRVEIKVRDKKGGKRSSNRAVSLTPVYNSFDKETVVTIDQPQSLLLVFDVFTIAEKKKLEFSFYEEHGDRQLHLAISGKKLLRADSLLISNLNQTTDGSGEF